MRKSVSRHTRQKDVMLQGLRECEGFVSAQDLHRRLSDGGLNIGLATVYRQLRSLEEVGSVDTIRLNGQQMFRICEDNGHHHHLICERCGRTVEIEPPDEQWLRHIASDHGFTMTSHTLEVFGLCPDCQRRDDADHAGADTQVQTAAQAGAQTVA